MYTYMILIQESLSLSLYIYVYKYICFLGKYIISYPEEFPGDSSCWLFEKQISFCRNISCKSRNLKYALVN